MINMGSRKITPTEFKYLKELILKCRGNLHSAADISGRSYCSISYIVKADTFKEYCQIRPGGYKYNLIPRRSRKKTSKTEVKLVKAKRVLSNESKAILAELKNVRKATFAVCGELKKMNNTKTLIHPTLPTLEQIPLEDCKKANNHAINFVAATVGILLVIWGMSIIF